MCRSASVKSYIPPAAHSVYYALIIPFLRPFVNTAGKEKFFCNIKTADGTVRGAVRRYSIATLRLVGNPAIGADAAVAAVGKVCVAAGADHIVDRFFRLFARGRLNQTVAVADERGKVAFRQADVQFDADFLFGTPQVRGKSLHVPQLQNLNRINVAPQIPLVAVGDPQERNAVKAAARKDNAEYKEECGDRKPVGFGSAEYDQRHAHNHQDRPDQCEYEKGTDGLINFFHGVLCHLSAFLLPPDGTFLFSIIPFLPLKVNIFLKKSGLSSGRGKKDLGALPRGLSLPYSEIRFA